MIKLKVISKYTLTAKFLFSVFALLFSIFSNPYQQAINYASALNSSSQDLTPRVAIASNNLIYLIVDALAELAINPRQISFLINFSLLYLISNGLGSLYKLLGFSSKNAILLSIFSISTYTFASPVSYEIQVSGPISQARITPILVIYVLNALCARDSKRHTIRITLLIGLCLWVHLVIGIFLAVFVLAMSWKSNSVQKFRNSTFISTSLVSFFFIVMYSNNRISGTSSSASLNWLETAIKIPFCQHYTNIFNIYSSVNVSRALSASLTFLFALFMMRLVSSREIMSKVKIASNGEDVTLEKIKYFFYFSIVTTIILNLALLKLNPLTIYALGAMPFRFLDAANLFTFPILIYMVKRLQGENILPIILSILIFGRILNARIFNFYFHENNVHFLILCTLILVLYILHHSNINLKIRGLNRIGSQIGIYFIAAFLLTQVIHEAQKPEIYWSEISKLSSIEGFAGSTILTPPEVKFPVGLNRNMELLSHSELQSVLYVPDSTPYVERILRKYYATNLHRYFSGDSCALSPSVNIEKSWISRSQNEWKQMAAADKFSFIVAPSEWKMRMTPLLIIRLRYENPQNKISIYKP